MLVSAWASIFLNELENNFEICERMVEYMRQFQDAKGLDWEFMLIL